MQPVASFRICAAALLAAFSLALTGCTDGNQSSPSGAGTAAGIGSDAGIIDKTSIVDDYKVSPLEWETGGIADGGIYYTASVPGIEITAITAPRMTEAGLDRALEVAARWCQAQGKREWESGDPEGRRPAFYDDTWHMPGGCLD